MMLKLSWKSISQSIVMATAIAGVLTIEANALGAGFTPGNIVALRVGDGTTLNTTTTRVFLDEYQTTGGLPRVQSIDISSSATPNQFSMLGTYGSSNFEGIINLSQNGQYIVVGGYACPVGTANPSSVAANTIPRAMAKVDINTLSVDTSLLITTSALTGNIRGAISTDGSDFYAATFSQASGNASNIWYTNSGLAGDAVQIIQNTGTSFALRSLTIFNNQLYTVLGNLGSGNPNGLYQVGSGVPTTANNSLTTIAAGLNPPTFSNMEQTAFEFYIPGGSGRFWAADQVNALVKWDYNGTVWTPTTNFGSIGIAFCYGAALGKDAAGSDAVFVTPGSANPNNSIRAVNRSTGAVTTIASAATNTTVRGLVYIPTAVTTSTAAMDWSKYY